MKSFLETLKKYWYLFVIFVLTAAVVVVGFVEHSKMAALANFIKFAADNYQKRVDTIDDLAAKRAKKDQQTVKTYEEKTKQIEDKKETEMLKVKTKKQKEVAKLKDQTSEELAKKMKEEFKL